MGVWSFGSQFVAALPWVHLRPLPADLWVRAALWGRAPGLASQRSFQPSSGLLPQFLQHKVHAIIINITNNSKKKKKNNSNDENSNDRNHDSNSGAVMLMKITQTRIIIINNTDNNNAFFRFIRALLPNNGSRWHVSMDCYDCNFPAVAAGLWALSEDRMRDLAVAHGPTSSTDASEQLLPS